jgi:hypothetical protein
LEGIEPPFRELLLAAHRIQVHDFHIHGILEICLTRIVEGQVAVLSDA